MEQAFIGADYTQVPSNFLIGSKIIFFNFKLIFRFRTVRLMLFPIFSLFQAYISCALGISYVGYVMICFGVINAICSVLFGTLMKYTGRFPLMTLGFIVHFSLVMAKLIWAPSPDHPFVFFIVSSLWGVGDAVWQTQVNGRLSKSDSEIFTTIKSIKTILWQRFSFSGIYGTLFRRKKEAAFSNYRLWESAGFVIAYSFSTSLCASSKLYVLMAVLCLGFVGYVAVEILQKRKKQKQKEKAKADAVSAKEISPTVVEETDDEKDDIDDEIVITQL